MVTEFLHVGMTLSFESFVFYLQCGCKVTQFYWYDSS